MMSKKHNFNFVNVILIMLIPLLDNHQVVRDVE